MSSHWIGIFAAVAVVLAGCGTPPEKSDIPPPRFTAGDHWTLAFTETGTQKILNKTIQSADLASSNGTEYQVYWVSLEGARMRFTVRAVDGAEVSRIPQEAYTGRGGMSEYSPPCPSYFGDHGLRVPWTHECNWSFFSANMTSHQRLLLNQSVETWTHEILGRETIAVPAGTFETWHIQSVWSHRESRVVTDIWYSEELCHEIRVVEAGTNGDKVRELLSGSCAQGL